MTSHGVKLMTDKTADNGMGSWQPAQSVGNWGIGKAAPQGAGTRIRLDQNGEVITDPWTDGSNDGSQPILIPEGTDVGELMSSDPIVGLDSTNSSDFRPRLMPRQVDKNDSQRLRTRTIQPAASTTAMYDPVRDVTPATRIAPAPLQYTDNDEEIRERKPMDPWTEMGDNGITIDSTESDRKAQEDKEREARGEEPEQDENGKKIVQLLMLDGQSAFPQGFQGLTDGNRIAAAQDELIPLRDPNDLDKHLVITHRIEENPTLYPVDLVKQLHLSMHSSGEASDHNPETLRVANILDPIQETLDPKIWDNPTDDEPKLKSTINAWIKSALFGTLKNAGYKNPEQWISLIVTGSLTTYQWSEESDLDVSIWVDLNEFPDFQRSEMIKLIINELDGDMVPGTSHPIQCFVVDVTEIHSPQEIYKTGVRSAYNLDNDEWIVKPERERSKNVPTQFPDFFRKAKQSSAKMELLLKFQPDAAKAYWHFLHRRRRDDMRAGLGDYSESNIIYKMLANDGLFDDIARVTEEHIASVQQYPNGTLPKFKDGYGPLVYETENGGMLCGECANGENGSKASIDNEDPQWNLIETWIHNEGSPIFCNNCAIEASHNSDHSLCNYDCDAVQKSHNDDSHQLCKEFECEEKTEINFAHEDNKHHELYCTRQSCQTVANLHAKDDHSFCSARLCNSKANEIKKQELKDYWENLDKATE